MCERGVDGWATMIPRTGGRVERQFFQDDDLVVADLDRVVNLVDDVDTSDGVTRIQGEISLVLVQVALKDTIDAELLRNIFLP